MDPFFDLASGYEQLSGIPAKETLNYLNNPRFRLNTIEVNQRVDRIFVQNTYPKELPALLASDVFGTGVYQNTNLAASDHYGVFAKVGF